MCCFHHCLNQAKVDEKMQLKDVPGLHSCPFQDSGMAFTFPLPSNTHECIEKYIRYNQVTEKAFRTEKSRIHVCCQCWLDISFARVLSGKDTNDVFGEGGQDDKENRICVT